MIGTIRKHSTWMWWIVAGLTIISFVWWGASPGTRNGNGRSEGYGTLYGQTITTEEFDAARKEFFVSYFLQNQEFPDRNPSFKPTDIERETYVRLLLIAKAKQLGIHVTPEQQAAEANGVLRSLGRGQNVPLSALVERVLEPEHLDAADFQRCMAGNLAINQLMETLGMAGALVTPQQAAHLFDREHQEVAAQAVFFAATNFLPQVAVTPAGVQQFYTNAMALYRVPDRVRINYLEYDLTNFLAAAEQKEGKTNIAARAETYYAQKGMEAVPEAKTPEEAKAKLREMVLRQYAGEMAVNKGREFLTALFKLEPVAPENFVLLAKTNGLTVHTTEPFAEAEGPAEFPAPADLIKLSFLLNPESPFSIKPIPGAEAVYVVGLNQRLPSEIPPLSQIYERVAQDCKNYEAATKARAAGTNFYYSATVQMAAGKTFAQLAQASGQTPFALKPFSMSSTYVPEAEGHAEVDQVKRAAFSTQPGHLSAFEPTEEGGFVLYVQSLLPVDEAAKTTQLPAFTTQLRRQRVQNSFNVWLQSEAVRELANVPHFDEFTGRKPAAKGQ
jgi:hypothetical protein